MSQTTIPLKILQERWDELQEPYSKAMVCTCGGLRIFEFIPYAYNTSSQKIIRVGTGMALGSSGGVGGMAIGAAVGATAYGVSQYISYEQKKYGYYNQIAASTYQSQYSQIRAGLVDGGRNTNE